MQESVTVPGMPRRACMQEWTAEEKEIFRLIQAVEKLGGHPLLTDTVILLGKAKDKLSDFLELDREYYQAEILDKNGNLTGLTHDERGHLCCVGRGLKFKTATECLEYISKLDLPDDRYKATSHMDIQT